MTTIFRLPSSLVFSFFTVLFFSVSHLMLSPPANADTNNLQLIKKEEKTLKSADYQDPEQRKLLFSDLLAAKSEGEARAAEEKIWRFWMQGPNEDVSSRLAKAMERRRTYDYAGALEILNQVAKDAPDWAEVWNQRAFVYFLREEYDKSLADTDKAIALEPKHFGALAGKARILMGQGRARIGQKVLRDAVKIHPFLRERSMLIEIPGQEL